MKLLLSKHRKSNTNNNRGFSLIEMVTVIGIFAFLSGVIFANYNLFNVKASLDNLAHQVAISVRQAQVYGIGVLKTITQKGYGMYFSTASEGDKSTFILFNDYLPADGLYSSGSESSCNGSDECLEITRINTKDTIDRIVANEKTAPSGSFALKNVSIVFLRPDPDARITGTKLDDSLASQISDVEIYLHSPKGYERVVVVWATGQVSVE